MGNAETEMHVFHYATHSMLWQITTTADTGCFTRANHLHTPGGDDAIILCFHYFTRDSAELSIEGTVADHVDNGDVLGAVRVIRHRDDAVRVAAGELTATR